MIGWAFLIVGAAIGTVRGIEEALRIYVERRCRE